jgi:hypothetical protein
MAGKHGHSARDREPTALRRAAARVHLRDDLAVIECLQGDVVRLPGVHGVGTEDGRHEAESEID